MKNFTYYRPTSIEQAVGLLDKTWDKTELLAGGTDLLDRQKDYISQPTKVVSLGGIVDLGFIEKSTEGKQVRFKIGAGVKLAEIAASKDLQAVAAGLAAAAKAIAGPQIRNMGTLGGNLCQRNRCWYFRDEHLVCLLKDKDARCLARAGDNRYHAVFMDKNECVMVHPSTLAPSLIALGATVQVLGPKGKRDIEVAKFFKTPASPADREHALSADELVLSVTLSVPDSIKSANYEVNHKLSYDWPLAQAAVSFALDGGKATNVKVVLGHVAPTPIVSTAAAESIEGKEVNEETAAAAGQAATKGAKPLAQNAYKVKLVAVAVKRALLTAAGAKKYWQA